MKPINKLAVCIFSIFAFSAQTDAREKVKPSNNAKQLQLANELLEGMMKCSQIAAPVYRLMCFDELTGRTPKEPAKSVEIKEPAKSVQMSTELEDLTKKAEQGDAKAQSDLGLVYANGKDVPRDYKQAVYWYELAANQGYALAQRNLGIQYFNGLGVPQDYKKAYIWLYLSATNGGFLYKTNRDNAAKKLTSEELQAAQAEATELSKKISERTPAPAK